MGVVTTVYSMPPNLMRKIRKDNDNLANLLEPEDENLRWKVETYDFDTIIESLIQILRESGYQKTAKRIDCENYFYSDNGTLEYNGYDIWAIPPSQVRTMAKDLETATFEELKTKGLGG